MCDKIDKCKDKDLVALWQAHVDHIGVGSTTKNAHMPWVIIKHKKRAGGRYRLLFSATRGETDYETSNNSQKVKLIRRCFYFTTLLKKCQYVLRKNNVSQNVSQNVSR